MYTMSVRLEGSSRQVVGEETTARSTDNTVFADSYGFFSVVLLFVGVVFLPSCMRPLLL